MKPSSALSALAAAATTAAAIVALASPGSAATAPAWTPTQNVSDGFARTVAPGWGSAPQGGVWETKSSSLFSVAAHTGRISVPAPGGTVMQMLNSVSAANELARLSFALPSLPTAANGQYITLRSRVQNDGSALVAQIRVQKTGALSLSLQQLVGTTATALSTTVAVPYTAAAGEKFDLDLQATGAAPSTAVTARAYPANLTATPDWQVRGTASARSLAGSLAISLHIDSATATASAAPVDVTSVTGWALSQIAPPAAPMPGPTNTGVPVGTHLTVHNGDLNLNVPGMVVSGLDIHGNVNVTAPNVVLKNSIVRGGALPTHGHCIVEDNKASNGLNFLIEDTELAPTNINAFADNLCGGNFTALRINSHSGVDAVDVAGNNVTIRDSWLHDMTYFAIDPYHTNGSHNDGIEITVGRNIRIEHNTIRGGNNSGIQVTQDQGVTTGLVLTGNWFDGGTCSLNVDDKPLTSLTGLTVTGNTFAPDSTIAGCAAVVTHAVTMSWTANTWLNGSSARPIIYG